MGERGNCETLVHGAGGILGQASQARADAVVVDHGQVVALGVADELRREWRPREEIDAAGLLLLPGLIDAHTHPVFARGRAEEFDWRGQGMDYLEIAARGGGIHASVAALRACDEAELVDKVAAHFRRMLAHGTTTCEAKSGYGLSLEDELKSLRAIRAAAERTGMQAHATCLAGHMIPLEHQERPEHYLDMVCEELLPEVRRQDLARAVDVFIEAGALDLAQARRYLERGRELGFALRVHADQFHDLGGTELAVQLGAESVDHLEVLSDAGLEALALGGRTYAGLLPAVPHFLRQKTDAPARRLLQAGVPYFIATDFNPGSCYTPSLFEAAHFARVRLCLSAAEALHGVTAGAAGSLGLGAHKGRLEPGYDADFLLCDLADVHHFGYGFGDNPVRQVFVGGQRIR